MWPKMSHSPAISISLIVAGIFLGVSPGLHAQIQGMQTFENRKEGTNVHPNAAPDLTLIAIHRNFENFSANSNLHVRFFLPPVADVRTRKVFLEWPTKDVIDRLGLQPNNIGVLARYEVAGAPAVYLPVGVYQTDSNAKKRAYTFHFITASDLQTLDVSVTNEKGVVNKAPKLQFSCNRNYNPNCRLYAAGSTQAFTLDMSALQPGEFHIKLLGRIPGDITPVSLDFVIYHQLK